MQQPIYWPQKLPSNPNTYQKAYDSLELQSSQGGHPKDDIDGIFGKGNIITQFLLRPLAQHLYSRWSVANLSPEKTMDHNLIRCTFVINKVSGAHRIARSS